VGEALLEVSGLTKRYGRVEALRGIDLRVERGAVYGFLGPNGAGKTTTIRILAGLVRPTSGRAFLHGVDLRADRLAAARGLRTLVEVPAFYPTLTGEENLRVFARLCGAPREDVERLLGRVGLSHARDRAAGGYSLGMRQRLGIAQALLGRPDLVVLDEPMNGLDPAGMHEMRDLIREENRERGVTFFLSSHLLHDVELLCDRIGVLHRGRLVAEGRIEDLLSRAVSGFRVRVGDPGKALARLRSDAPAVRAEADAEGTVTVHGDAAVLPAVHGALLAAGEPAQEVTPIRESLERYFLDLTEGVMG
jgi:ABC-2 type transport system ATP-binding protein